MRRGGGNAGGPTAWLRFQPHLGGGSVDLPMEITVPNCAGEVMLAAKQGLALLAPTNCNADPISVVDLIGHKFVKNLPGFGPVAVMDGVAVGFASHQALGESQAGMALVKVDLASLATSTIDVGASAPLYTPTPDGKSLLVWDGWGGWLKPANPRTVRLADGLTEPFDNWTVAPDALVWLADGTAATLSFGLLFRLDPKTHKVSNVPLSGHYPELLRTIGAGTELLMGEADRPTVYRYALNKGQLSTHDLSLPGVQIQTNPEEVLASKPAEGWSQVTVVGVTTTGLADCATTTTGPILANVAVQKSAPSGNSWQDLQDWKHFDEEYPCLLSSANIAGYVDMPVDLQGQRLVVRPTAKMVQTWADMVTTIRPGMRVQVTRAADLQGAPCQDTAPCAQVPLRLTLVPPWYPTVVPGKVKDLGVFVGKGSFEVMVPPL